MGRRKEVVSKMNRYFINKLWIGELQNIICNIFTHQLQTRRKFSVQLIFFFFLFFMIHQQICFPMVTERTIFFETPDKSEKGFIWQRTYKTICYSRHFYKNKLVPVNDTLTVYIILQCKLFLFTCTIYIKQYFINVHILNTTYNTTSVVLILQDVCSRKKSRQQ